MSVWFPLCVVEWAHVGRSVKMRDANDLRLCLTCLFQQQLVCMSVLHAFECDLCKSVSV